MLAPEPIWGIDMQLNQKARDVAEAARDRVSFVVQNSSFSFKGISIIFVVAFALGFYVSTKWDFSRFQKFRSDMANLERRHEAEKARLIAELATLRTTLDAERLARNVEDKAFDTLINKPGPRTCLVPVEEVNPIIAEAGR